MDILPHALCDSKRCFRCGELKPRSEFHRNHHLSDGLQSSCISCLVAYKKEWYLRNRERLDAKSLAWAKANPDRVSKRMRRNYSKTDVKQRVKTQVRKWQTANRERVAELARRRRSEKVVNGGSHTEEQFERLCDAYGNKCLACGATAPLTRDHIVPVTKGGSGDIGNIQPLCQPCNSRKRDNTQDFRPFLVTIITT